MEPIISNGNFWEGIAEGPQEHELAKMNIYDACVKESPLGSCNVTHQESDTNNPPQKKGKRKFDKNTKRVRK